MGTHTQQSIWFDLDDTLYDQLRPFHQAVKTSIPVMNLDQAVIEQVFRRMRHHSDLLWDQHVAGEISLEELRLQRLVRAFADMGLAVPVDECRELQAEYLGELDQIHLFAGVMECLQELTKEGFQLGIITNGPVQHQLNKIRRLNLLSLISADRVMISDALGVAKPDPRIFARVNQLTSTSPEQSIYVGDSWRNDIVSALAAGWKPVWFNHRRKAAESEHIPYQVITELNELRKLSGDY